MHDILLMCVNYKIVGNSFFVSSLKEKGVLHAEFAKADMRTKVYYTTSDGDEFVKEELNKFVKAIEVVMSLIEGGSDV
jgi:hypothetical protein